MDFLGFIFPISDFPYPIKVLNSSYIAVVPPDVFDFALNYRAVIPDQDDSTFTDAESSQAQAQRDTRAPGPV